MKKLFAGSVVAIALFFTIAAPVGVFAQVNYDAAPQSQSDTVPPGSVNDTIDDQGFNPLWLLPLLAIPVLYFALRPGEDNTTEYRTPQAAVGYKGGEVSKDRDDDEFV